MFSVFKLRQFSFSKNLNFYLGHGHSEIPCLCLRCLQCPSVMEYRLTRALPVQGLDKSSLGGTVRTLPWLVVAVVPVHVVHKASEPATLLAEEGCNSLEKFRIKMESIPAQFADAKLAIILRNLPLCFVTQSFLQFLEILRNLRQHSLILFSFQWQPLLTFLGLPLFFFPPSATTGLGPKPERICKFCLYNFDLFKPFGHSLSFLITLISSSLVRLSIILCFSAGLG